MNDHAASSQPVHRWSWIAALAVGMVLFVASAIGASPGIAALDAGDFVTASAELGVPHATGFPLQVMFGQLMTWLPFGSIAFRVSLVSSLSMSVALVFVTLAIARFAGSEAAGLVVGLSTLIAALRVPTLVLHARVPEVYALNLALLAICLWLVARIRDDSDANDWVLLGGVMGLGLANHATFRMYAPVLYLSAFLMDEERSTRRGIASALAATLVAFMAYAYVFVAACSGPEHNWGHATTLSAWWAHINASEIRSGYSDEMYPTPFHVWQYLRQLWGQLAAVAPLLAIGGIASLAALLPQCRWLMLFAAAAAADLVYSVAINPMGVVDYQNGQVVAFMLAALAGWGSWRVAALASSSTMLVAGMSISVVMGAGLLVSAPSVSQEQVANDWAIEDLVTTSAELAPAEAVVSWGQDSTSSASLYVHRVLDARPDMLVVERYLFSRQPELADHLERSGEFELAEHVRELDGDPAEIAGRGMLAVLSYRGEGREILWETSGLDEELPSFLKLEHRWPIGRVVLASEPLEECSPVELSYCADTDPQWGSAARAASGSDYLPYRRWLATQWGFRGARLARQGDYFSAGAAFERASVLAPHVSAWRVSIAVCLASLGRVEEALALCDEVLESDPLNERAVSNGLLYAEALGDDDALARLRARAALLGLPE